MVQSFSKNGILLEVRFRIGEHKCGTLCLGNLRSAKSKSILKRNPSVDVKSSLLLPF